MNILEYENYQEKISHGELEFPYTTYLCSIPLDFVRVPLHWHDEMEFIYIKKGKGVVTIDLNRYEVESGDILMIIPGSLHSIEQYGTDAMEYENIIFHPNILLSKIPDVSNTEFLRPLFAGKKTMDVLYRKGTALYEKVAACIDANDEIRKTFPKGYELYLKSQLMMLFYYLVSESDRVQAANNSRENLKYLKVILKYIENHYMKKLTIADVAAQVGLSQSHFMKYFKNTMGTSFIEYLNDYRLIMASRLLRSSEASILAISEEIGFDNLSHFNRTFKKKYNMTPREYRKL